MVLSYITNLVDSSDTCGSVFDEKMIKWSLYFTKYLLENFQSVEIQIFQMRETGKGKRKIFVYKSTCALIHRYHGSPNVSVIEQQKLISKN